MIKIGNKEMEYPIIQGGMGVGISLGNLAGAVAGCGGMGVISTANPGFRKSDFWKNPRKCNEEGLIEEIKKAKTIFNKAKEKCGKAGLIAINAMVATTEYENMVKTAVKSGIDAIISGAGLPLKLPEYVKGSNVLLAPIVSGGRSIMTICKYWDKRYETTPDFVVVEGAKAGGHLGFSYEELINNTAKHNEELLKEVSSELRTYREKYNKDIPIFMAGGMFNHEDLVHYQGLGVAGIQVATRFIATKECDADEGYKDVIIAAKEENICITKSPVGMPGRALNTPLVKRVAKEGNIKVNKCANCLVPCNPTNTPYCITKALIEAAKGNVEEGLFFCGANVGKINKMTTVKALMNELVTGVEE